jgi:uncharacterized surface protein with fasciclin (FAS1) repeats
MQNFTIYAPTDAAFKALGFKTVADVTATEASTLRTILLNHAIGEVNLLQSRQVPLPTAGGGTLTYSPFFKRLLL